MTNRLSLEPPLASADTWAGRPRKSGDVVTPLAEHIVLDCLRALKAIMPSPHALELTDRISKGYLDTPEQTVRLRRIAALMEISAEESA